jgi:restriction modification system DNA specificity domain protein
MSQKFPKVRFNRFARIHGGGTPQSNPSYWGGSIPFATPKDLRPVDGKKLLKTERTLTVEGARRGSSIAQPGDVLLSVRAPVGYSVLVETEVAFSQGCKALSLDKSKAFAPFIVYAINAFKPTLESAANGTTFQELSSRGIAESSIPLPDFATQQQIVQYLDKETAKIDHLIAKQRELISLLEERLSAFMENALVKGISHDNTSPMEWRRVKHLFKLRDERNHLEREEVTLLSLYAKHGVRKYDEIEERTGNPVRTVQDYKCVHAGDIIVNIILAWMGSIGRSPHNGVISPAYDIWAPLEGVSSRYYHYLFRTKWFSGECYKRGKGIMMMRWRTYADQFGDIRVPFPTQQEQDYLVNLIEQEESQVQNLISKCQRMIDLLQERRSALITAAVTGQIEV